MSQATDTVLALLREMSGDEDPQAVAARRVAPDFHNHHAPMARPDGPEGFAGTLRNLRAAFPDLTQEIDDVVTEGDRVVVRTTFAGTNDGPFMGRPATGRPLRMAQIHIFRVQDGLVAEHWACLDEMGAMRQLGMLPAPAPVG